jgi:3-phosphoshikimate 1-carboxyvinyltransferase
MSTTLEILPRRLSGRVHIQSCKNLIHRALVCGALSYGHTMIPYAAMTEEVITTAKGLVSMGLCQIQHSPAPDSQTESGCNRLFRCETLDISGGRFPVMQKISLQMGMELPEAPLIRCGNSSSTLRLLIPLAALTGQRIVFSGRISLLTRTMEMYQQIFSGQDIQLSLQDNQLTVEGSLKPGEFVIPPNASSLYASGLLFALPMLEGDSQIRLLLPIRTSTYVEMTREILGAFGILTACQSTADCLEFTVPGQQRYYSCVYHAEGDYSHASPFLAAGAMGGDVLCCGLAADSLQAERQILSTLTDMGADLQVTENSDKADDNFSAITFHHPVSFPVSVDLTQTPDLIPITAVLACACKGRSTLQIRQADLREEEQIRIEATVEALSILGADIQLQKGKILINGHGSLTAGRVSCKGDPRLAMALAAAASIAKGNIYLDDHQGLADSEPAFWDEYRSLGGIVNEYHMEPSMQGN